MEQNGGVEGYALFSCENSKIVAHCPSAGKCQILSKIDTPYPRAKEKPEQDGRKGKIMFRIKPHTCQRCSEGSGRTLCSPGPRDPTGTEPDPLFSSGLLQGQKLWVQLPRSHSLWHKPSLLEEITIRATREPMN